MVLSNIKIWCPTQKFWTCCFFWHRSPIWCWSNYLGLYHMTENALHFAAVQAELLYLISTLSCKGSQ